MEPRRPSELDPSALIDAVLQRRYYKTSNLARLTSNLHLSMFFHYLPRWEQGVSRTFSTCSNPCQRRVADQIPSSTRWLSDSASGFFMGMFCFLSDWTVTAGQAWNMGWPIVRWPLIFLATVLTGLNAVNFAYTVTHEAFLSNFYTKELPLVRNWMCSAWDKRLRSGQESVKGRERFTDSLGSLLLRNGSASSYMLPHILGRYETIVCSLIVNLPVSQFSAIDQDYLHEHFTAFLNQSSVTIRSSKEFHSHIMRTISRFISDQYYVDKIYEYNLTSIPPNERTFEITFKTDDSISRSMAWFNSHSMVYLQALNLFARESCDFLRRRVYLTCKSMSLP